MRSENTKLSEYGTAWWGRSYKYSLPEYARFQKIYRFNYDKFLPNDKHCRVLEVGCAGGRFLNYLQKKGYTSLHGIDLDGNAVEHCRRNVSVNAEQADAMDFLQSHIGQYDLIVSNHVIEHFTREESFEFLRRIYRSLRPRGRAIIATPNAMSPWACYHLFNDLTHDHFYTPESLRQALLMSGFTAATIRPESPVPYDFLTGVRYFVWKIREFYIKAQFAVDVGAGRNMRTQLVVSPAIIGVADKEE